MLVRYRFSITASVMILLLLPLINSGLPFEKASASSYDYSKLKEHRDFTPHAYDENDDTITKDQLAGQLDELIVKLDNKAKKSTLNSLNKKIGAKIIEENKKTKLYVIEIPDKISIQQAVDYYEEKSIIEYVEPNYHVRRLLTLPNDSDFNQLWGLHNTGQTGGKSNSDINAPEAWDRTTDCSNVVVGVMDDGIETSHSDLADNIWTNSLETIDEIDNDGNGYVDDVNGYDFANDDPDPSPDVDTDAFAGHGTHVAGIIGASGNNGIGITGVCWDVQLMPLKIFDSSGFATISNIVEAAQYAVSMKNQGVNIKVINMSFGSYTASQAEFDALEALRDAGILVTAAAGNDGFNADKDWALYPASYELDNVISVAASDDKDKKTSFSNYGTNKVDLAAPGSGILSSFVEDSFESFSGTSMAAPHVAGVAAMVATDNSLDYAEIRAKILNGVKSISALAKSVATGGRLNAIGALDASSNLPDIAVTNMDASFSERDQTATIKVTIKNLGDTLADSTFVSLFAATDPDFENIVVSDNESVVSLKAKKTTVITFTLDLGDIEASPLYLLAVSDLDEWLFESNEENNEMEGTVSLSKKDLYASSLSTKSGTGTSSTKIVRTDLNSKATITVKNVGKERITDDITVKLYLSTDAVLDDGDAELGTGVLTKNIDKKKTQKVTINFLVTSETIEEDVQYYLIAFVDADESVQEISEVNNSIAKSIKIG